MKITKDEQYAIVAVAGLLRDRKPRGTLIVLDDCAVSGRDAALLVGMADRAEPGLWAADARPITEDEI